MARSRERQPRWLSRQIVDAIHEAQLREHGGAVGVRDEGLLESALGRPQHKLVYAKRVDLALLAAAYAFGFARGHPYVDGNKRVSFMAAYVFLGLNGRDLDADETDVVATIQDLAAGRLTEATLARWIRDRIRPRGV